MHGPWDRGWDRHWGARGRRGFDPLSGFSAWSEFWRGPPPRPERGVVRWLILDAIAHQPRHGYQIIKAIDERTQGAYKPSAGVVYPTLQLLEELGHARQVAHVERKPYEITDEGRAELREHADEVTEFYASKSDPSFERHADDVAHVWMRVGHVMRLFKRAMHRGELRPATMRKARAILDEALTKLEMLVEPEDP